MALVSMTGFGRGEASSGGVRVEVELSSVNRKQFDLHFNLPKALATREARLYELIHQALPRGAVTGSAQIGVSGKTVRQHVSVDHDRAAAYVAALSGSARRLGLKNDLTAQSLLQFPDVVRLDAPEKDLSQVWPLVEKAAVLALKGLSVMKRKEGKTIEKDLLRRLSGLQTVLRAIKKVAPTVSADYRQSLQSRLRDAGFDLSATDPAMLKDVALFAERADVSEEIVRLESHFSQAFDLIRSDTPSGRSLDFLCQEMLREINTIGSKANHGTITRDVIRFKAGLESVREQIQNVE